MPRISIIYIYCYAIISLLFTACTKEESFISYSVTTAVVNGQITPGPISFDRSIGYIKIVYSPAVNCTLDSVIVNGINYPDSTESYTFTSLSQNTTIKVVYKSNVETRNLLLGNWQNTFRQVLPGISTVDYLPYTSDTIYSITENVVISAVGNSSTKVQVLHQGDPLNPNDNFYDTFEVVGTNLVGNLTSLVRLNRNLNLPNDSLEGNIQQTVNGQNNKIDLMANTLSINYSFSWTISVSKSLYKNPPDPILRIIGYITSFNKAYTESLNNGTIKEYYVRR